MRLCMRASSARPYKLTKVRLSFVVVVNSIRTTIRNQAPEFHAGARGVLGLAECARRRFRASNSMHAYALAYAYAYQ